MPLPLPDLDDRRFDDLLADARALIPSLAPGWTNHNAADPGITLIELFAYLTEALIYRLNRVTDANRLSFLRLLNGPGWAPSADGDLGADIRATVMRLRQCDRAVTAADYELLARLADPRVARARCLPGAALDGPPADVVVVVLPAREALPLDDPRRAIATLSEIMAAVAAFLEPRRLLATKLRVAPPQTVEIALALTLNLTPDALPAAVAAAARAALQRFLDPWVGGEDGTGWPFGRALYHSEIHALLRGVPGVDHITRVAGRPEIESGGMPILNDQGDRIGLRLGPDALIHPVIDTTALATAVPPPR